MNGLSVEDKIIASSEQTTKLTYSNITVDQPDPLFIVP